MTVESRVFPFLPGPVPISSLLSVMLGDTSRMTMTRDVRSLRSHVCSAGSRNTNTWTA